MIMIRVLAGVLLAGLVSAQPLLRERRTHARVLELRHQLLCELEGASADLLAGVAADLLSDAEGSAFLPLARALARVRSVKADAAFVFRHGVQVFAMPEIIDGDRYKEAAVTVHLPFRPEPVGRLTFRVVVRDGGGKTVWDSAIEERTSMDDLLRFTCGTKIPIKDLPDGRYAVDVETLIEGVSPRPADPRSSTCFHVQRDLAERVNRLAEGYKALESSEKSGPHQVAMLVGMLARIQRVIEGEPSSGKSLGGKDLDDALRLLENIEKGLPPLAGLRGWVTIGVVVGEDEPAMVRLRLPVAGEAPRPLVLFVPGSPAYSPTWWRPTSPRSVAPGWLADELDIVGFDSDARWHLAVMESPGRYQGNARVVRGVIDGLRKMLPVGEVVLVGEREGALAAVQTVVETTDLAVGVVLIAGGSLGPADADTLAGQVRMLCIPATGYPGNHNLRRLADLLEKGVEMLDAGGRPWPMALGISAREIEGFVTELGR